MKDFKIPHCDEGFDSEEEDLSLDNDSEDYKDHDSDFKKFPGSLFKKKRNDRRVKRREREQEDEDEVTWLSHYKLGKKSWTDWKDVYLEHSSKILDFKTSDRRVVWFDGFKSFHFKLLRLFELHVKLDSKMREWNKRHGYHTGDWYGKKNFRFDYSDAEDWISDSRDFYYQVLVVVKELKSLKKCLESCSSLKDSSFSSESWRRVKYHFKYCTMNVKAWLNHYLYVYKHVEGL